MQCCPANDGDFLSTKLASVNGLDVKTGLFYAGGNEQAYAETLRRFCAEYERHQATIELCLADQNWKACSTKFHAMKGLLATIGATLLSEKAHTLELAAKNGDAGTCQRDTPGFCAEVRGFKESLCAISLVPPSDNGPRAFVLPAVLAEKLTLLRRACLEGDSDVADAVAAELGALSVGGENDVDACLDEIRSLADSLDYGEAVKKIDALLQKPNFV